MQLNKEITEITKLQTLRTGPFPKELLKGVGILTVLHIFSYIVWQLESSQGQWWQSNLWDEKAETQPPQFYQSRFFSPPTLHRRPCTYLKKVGCCYLMSLFCSSTLLGSWRSRLFNISRKEAILFSTSL